MMEAYGRLEELFLFFGVGGIDREFIYIIFSSPFSFPFFFLFVLLCLESNVCSGETTTGMSVFEKYATT